MTEKTLYQVFAEADAPIIIPSDSRPRVSEMIDIVAAGVMKLNTIDGLPVTPEHADERARNIVNSLMCLEWIESAIGRD